MKYFKFIFSVIFLFLFISCNSDNNNKSDIVNIENYIEKEDYKIALDEIENLTKKDFFYYNLKGKCLMAMDNHIRVRSANKMFYYAYLYQPNNLDNLILLAESFFEIKEIKKASKYYKKCLKICKVESKNDKERLIYEKLIKIDFINQKYDKVLQYIEFLESETILSNYIYVIKIISKKKLLKQEIELYDIKSLFYDETISRDELYIIFDNFIPDNIDLFRIFLQKQNLNFSKQFCKVCSIYKIFFLLIDDKNDDALKDINKLQEESFIDYQFDKVISFYYWNIKNYELANWNADFYFFKFNHLLKQNIKRSNSKKTFEKKFKNDSMFRFLKITKFDSN